MAAMPSKPIDLPPRKSATRSLFPLIFAIVSGIGVAVLGFIALGLVAANLEESPDIAAQMARSARWIVDHRTWVPLLCAPPIALAVRALARRSSSSARWLSFIVAELWLLIVFGAVLYAFIASLAPAYQYQPLD